MGFVCGRTKVQFEIGKVVGVSLCNSIINFCLHLKARVREVSDVGIVMFGVVSAYQSNSRIR